LALALKEYFKKKSGEDEEIDRRGYSPEELKAIKRSREAARAIGKISREEYDYEAVYLTRNAVRNLYGSKEFKTLQARKGEEIAEWNWQVKEGDEAPADFNNIEEEILKVDRVIAKEGGGPLKASPGKGTPGAYGLRNKATPATRRNTSSAKKHQ